MTVRQTRIVRRTGFTLMEVLVVVAILVILAGVGSVAIFKYLDEAKESTARLQIKNIETAVQAYKIKHGDYPETLDALVVAEDGKPAPLDPSQLDDPWKRRYEYHPQDLDSTGKPLIFSHGATPGNEAGVISNRQHK
jgi:general secretion pathway protein G